MNRPEIVKLFEQINVWQRGDQRAPHKPLLLLYALGKCRRGEARQIAYQEIDDHLKPLLMEFGPSRKSYHTEYPFWRLQNDGVWDLSETENLKRRKGNNDARKSELLEHDVHGGLIEPIFSRLQTDNRLLNELVNLLLERNFPSTLHEDIRSAVGLDESLYESQQRRRDPNFRQRVMLAYSYRCAVCGFDIRIGQTTIGLEAAHIKWHQAGGPDNVTNGLSLCVTHHKLLDLGAFTLSDERQILVSDRVHGYKGVDEWLLRFHGTQLALPQNLDDVPKSIFTRWHRGQVFKGTARR